MLKTASSFPDVCNMSNTGRRTEIAPTSRNDENGTCSMNLLPVQVCVLQSPEQFYNSDYKIHHSQLVHNACTHLVHTYPYSNLSPKTLELSTLHQIAHLRLDPNGAESKRQEFHSGFGLLNPRATKPPRYANPAN